MAIQIRVIATITTNTGVVRFEYDYDDAANRLWVTAVRCVNTSTEAAYGELVMLSNGRKYGARFAPGTTEIAVPTAANLRIQHFINANGKLDGIDKNILVPYP